jgi:hypothetical protein
MSMKARNLQVEERRANKGADGIRIWCCVLKQDDGCASGA